MKIFLLVGPNKYSVTRFFVQDLRDLYHLLKSTWPTIRNTERHTKRVTDTLANWRRFFPNSHFSPIQWRWWGVVFKDPNSEEYKVYLE